MLRRPQAQAPCQDTILLFTFALPYAIFIAIGTGVMIVPGMLNELSAGLAISSAQVGMLISAFAMTICVTGPFFAGWTSAIERRKLLAAALMLYAVMHWAAALAPELASASVSLNSSAIYLGQATR